jgi:hypothetical protein
MGHQPLTRLCIASLALSALSLGTARADETGAPEYTISGFGTVGLAHSSESQADFTNSPFIKKTGAGFSDDWSANVDSVFGVQVRANINPQVSAVLQVISQQRYDGTYTPEVEWANVKYQFTPDFNMRVGRIAMPTLLVSDYRYVGYSIPWVRAPMDLYGFIPITKNDGVDASYQLRIGGAKSTFQASFGNSEIKNSNGVTPSLIKNAAGIFNTTEIGPTVFHFAYQEADLSLPPTNPLFDGFRQFGPAGVAIAEKYNANNRRIQLTALGAIHDTDDWFVMGEWIKLESDSFIGTQTGWYVSGGYRMGEFTPFATYSQSEKKSNTSDPGLNPATLPPSLAGSAAALNTALNGILQGASGQTLSLGSRWDFRRNAAFKLQYDLVKLNADSSGILTNKQPGYQPGGSYNVFSVALNFVF